MNIALIPSFEKRGNGLATSTPTLERVQFRGIQGKRCPLHGSQNSSLSITGAVDCLRSRCNYL